MTKPEAESVLQRSIKRAFKDILNVLLLTICPGAAALLLLASEEVAIAFCGVVRRSIF